METHDYDSEYESEIDNYEMDAALDAELERELARPSTNILYQPTEQIQQNHDSELDEVIQRSLNDFAPPVQSQQNDDDELADAIQRSLNEYTRPSSFHTNQDEELDNIIQRSLLDFGPKEPENIILEAISNELLMDSDKVILPLQFMDTVCGSNDPNNVTVFKIKWIANPENNYTYGTLSDFSNESDFIQLSPTKLMEINPNMDNGDILCIEMQQIQNIPKCAKLVLEPSTPEFLDIKDQYELVNGVIGRLYRVFWQGQYLSIHSQELDKIINFTVLDTGSEFRDGLAQAVDIDVEITFSCDENLIAKWKASKPPVSTFIPPPIVTPQPIPDPQPAPGHVLNPASQSSDEEPVKLTREELRARRLAFLGNK